MRTKLNQYIVYNHVPRSAFLYIAVQSIFPTYIVRCDILS